MRGEGRIEIKKINPECTCFWNKQKQNIYGFCINDFGSDIKSDNVVEQNNLCWSFFDFQDSLNQKIIACSTLEENYISTFELWQTNMSKLSKLNHNIMKKFEQDSVQIIIKIQNNNSNIFDEKQEAQQLSGKINANSLIGCNGNLKEIQNICLNFIKDDNKLFLKEQENILKLLNVLNDLLKIYLEQSLLDFCRQQESTIKRFLQILLDFAIPQYEKIVQTLEHSQLYELGMKLFDCKTGIEAIYCFDQVIKMNPDFNLAYIQKSRSLSGLQHFQEAFLLIDKALQINKHESLAYYAKGNALFGVKEYQEAIEYYNKAISLKSNDFKYYQNKALTLKGLGKLTEALECVDDAIKLNPVDSDLYTGKGRVLGMMNNYQQAIANFDEAIKLNPADSFAFMYKGDTLSDMMQFEEAYISLQKAQQLNPFNYNIYIHKGNALFGLDRKDEALEQYDKAIEIAPSSDIYFNKGLTLFTMQRYVQAIQSYDQAIKYDPYSFDSYKFKGEALIEIEKYNEAIRCLNEAIIFNPRDGHSHNLKGRALYKMNNYAEALRCYDVALLLEPGNQIFLSNRQQVIKKKIQNAKKNRYRCVNSSKEIRILCNLMN